MESIIKDNILQYARKNNFITRQQHGFLARRSTTTQLLECINDWSLALAHRQSVDVTYIDFSRAFDSVVHSKLIYKLRSYGIAGNLLSWIEDFLTNRHQAVRVGNNISDFADVGSGVPQGSVLGPLLFLFFINDISDLFGTDLVIKLYADDVKIYVAIDNISSSDNLQVGLNALIKWCEDWQLNVSINKCNVLHIGAKNSCHTYTMNAFCLPSVRLSTDLGVLVDSKLRFTDHYAAIVAKAHQRAALILRCFKCRDPCILYKAFTTYVRPLLETCSNVWCPVYKCDVDYIEKVQRRFTKRLYGLHDLSYTERLHFLAAETLEARRLKLDLVMMFKILHNLVDLNISDFFTLSNVVQTRGHCLKLIKPIATVNARQFSFACRRIDSWNSLPASVVIAPSIAAFKRMLNNVDLSQYLIYSCRG